MISPLAKEVPVTTEWHTAFRVLAHELRSTVGVIAGYTRILESGRLDETGRVDVLRQIDRATDRLAQFGHHAADLARWLEPRMAITGDMVDLAAILDDARTASAETALLPAGAGDQVGHLSVRTPDRRALSGALATIVHACIREGAPDAAMGLLARSGPDSDWCDILIGPNAQLLHLEDIRPVDEPPAFDLNQGGLGLRLLLSAAILGAHGGRLWACAGRRGVARVRLPVFTRTGLEEA